MRFLSGRISADHCELNTNNRGTRGSVFDASSEIEATPVQSWELANKLLRLRRVSRKGTERARNGRLTSYIPSYQHH